jgi:hypothetical protein
VSGPDAGALAPVADGIARGLFARQLPVEVLDGRTPGMDTLEGEGVERRVAFVAGLLARHGVATIVAVPASRAVRDRARAELGRLIEVNVRPAGAPAEPTEIEILVPEASPGAGVERTLHTLEVLEYLPPGQDRAYSEEEEREVIRRLKAFGYL